MQETKDNNIIKPEKRTIYLRLKVLQDLKSIWPGNEIYFVIPMDNAGKIVMLPIEVASVINRKALARAGSWFMNQIYLPAIDTVVTGMMLPTGDGI